MPPCSLPSLLAHLKNPSDVWKAETSSDMNRPMIRMKIEMSGQPQAIAAGPPLFQPRPNEVKQPARIEMIENEMAKLEKPEHDRCNSCTWTSLARCCSSSVKCSWPSGTAVLLRGSDSAGSLGTIGLYWSGVLPLGMTTAENFPAGYPAGRLAGVSSVPELSPFRY